MMLRSYRFWLIGFFLLAISFLPLAQAVVEASRGEWPQALDLFRQVPTAANLRAFERETERTSVIASFVRPWVQTLRFVLLRDPGEKTTLGSGGWLFYKPDVQYLIEPFRFHDSSATLNPVGAIVRFRDQLASRGIRLMVIPIPGKPSIYPERLTIRPLFGGELRQTHTRELLARLRQEGVETVDLLEPLLRWHLQGAGYLKRDTHWSAAAARKAAEFVANRIRNAGWGAEWTTEFISKPVSIYRRGDLVRIMEAPHLEDSFPEEQVQCEQVISKRTGKLYADVVQSPVLVLGDSYLRMYQTDEPKAAGFIAHLARELHTPLASIVNDGGASTLVRRQLARSPELLAGKKLVIWEFVERDIRFGAEGWQAVPLPDAPLPPVPVSGLAGSLSLR
jgi:hypothetical protein